MPVLRTNTQHWPPLTVVGLTGGIASGKTTVAEMFAELGAVVLNADDVGREVVEPGEPALAEIVAAFGPETLRADGTLDRRAVAERIFRSPADRKTLNRITHGRISDRLAGRLAGMARRAASGRGRVPSGRRVVVLEAAVLIEAGWERLVDRIVVVTTEHRTQVERLTGRLGISASEAEARIRAQIPLQRRLRHADYRVRGDAPLPETRRQVKDIWQVLNQPSPASVE